MYSFLFSKFDICFDKSKEELKRVINRDTKLVAIPWTFAVETDKDGVHTFYLEHVYKKYIERLISIDLDINNVKYLNCYSDKKEYMKNLINESDIILIPGGNPEMLYNKINDCDLMDTIKNYKKIVIGASAGSEIQLENYFITKKNNYYKKFDWYKGIGLIKDNFYFDVHSINDEEYLSQFKKISKEKNKKVYAIFDDGFILYNRENNNIKLYGNVIEFDYE